MNAAVLHAQGQTPHFEPFPDPEPGEHETLLTVRAASLKPIDRAIAAGSHYHHLDMLPTVVGVDGVGVLEDGTRVYSGGCRPPFGMMAERAPVPAAFRIPVPDALDDATAAALPNPAMSAWIALAWRARLEPGETVLVLGATGVAGRLAVQIARHLGAGRIVAAGRSESGLQRAVELGADAAIRLGDTVAETAAAFARAHHQDPFDIVLDYLWGEPSEALLGALTGHDVAAEGRRVRYVEIGASAGESIRLDAEVLRSSGLELYGSGGGSAPHAVIFEAIPKVLALAAEGTLRIDTETVPLAGIADAWSRPTPGRRVVIVP